LYGVIVAQIPSLCQVRGESTADGEIYDVMDKQGFCPPALVCYTGFGHLVTLSPGHLFGEFTTGHFLSNAQVPDAATRCGGLAAKINSANRVFASPGRQQVGASIKLSGSELANREWAVNRLYLVRHGENWANITKEFSCKRVDYPLTPKGMLQARQTAEYFKDKGIHEIYSSPLKRAVETAEIIAAPINLQVVVMENFREVNVGSLEGQPVSAELWALYFRVVEDWFAGRVGTRLPGGEDYVTLWGRMRAGVERIVAHKTGRNMIIVGHGGIFTATLKDLCRDVDVNWLRGSASHNCSITEIMIRLLDGRLEGELITWASHTHLHGAAADLVPGIPQVDILEGSGE